jgi:hypothetical protein
MIRKHADHTLWIGAPVPRGSEAITIGRHVFMRKRSIDDHELLTHELVHVAQWKAYGTIRFLSIYFGDYVSGRLRGYGHKGAYRRIRFEIEADWRARRETFGKHLG